jgi:CYTH domain-containing protein
MGVEIERKFLVDHNKWELLDKPDGNYLRQGYVVNDVNKVVRVRVTNQQAFITIKGAASGITRSEYEYGIPVKDGVELLDQFAAVCIEKTRYVIIFEGKAWEVDVFLGDNDGLIVAEIELGYEEEQFKLPYWIAGEVTGQEKYYNSNLSVHPFNRW